MTDPLFLSKSAFAVRIGRTPSYITWLKGNNRLVLSPDGKKVDVLATEALILETADPSKAAVAARHQQDRLQRDVYSQLSPLADAILYGHKWAVDRSITKTYVSDVTEGLAAFMRDLKNQGAVINFEVFADPTLNTASQLAQGKVYWNIRFTDVPPAENPNFRVEVTDQWLTEVLDTNA